MPDPFKPRVGAVASGADERVGANIASPLPQTYVITAGAPVDSAWWTTFQHVLDRGYRLVQLRLKSLPEAELRPVVVRAAQLARDRRCRLILNGPEEWVMSFGLAGLHLTSAKLMSLKARPIPADLLMGASCHNLQELLQAERIGADFACLGPVYRTESHAEQTPLGLKLFAEWMSQCRLPVYALGGMGQQDIASDIEAVRLAGGQGIAGISAFWRLKGPN